MSAAATASTAQAAGGPARLRIDYVDGMRALAALIVYVNHAYAQTWNPLYHLEPSGIFKLAQVSMVAGHLSVTVFIVLSGFCLTLPVVANGGELRGGVKLFLQRRARRILPPYYAALLLSLGLIFTVIGEPTGSLWDVPIQYRPSSIVAHFLLLQDLFGTGMINYVFWSIAVEWHIYFLVPLLVWAFRRYGAAKLVIGALVIGYALRFGFADTRLTRAHPQFIGMFALGMLAAHLVSSTDEVFVRLRQRVPWRVIAAFGFGTAVALAASWGVTLSEQRFHLLDVPVGIMSTALLVALSQRGSVIAKTFEARPLVFVGTFSYSLYLIHAPLLQIMWQYVLTPLGVSRNVQFSLLMTLGLALVLLVSYGFFLLFEAPFLRASRAKTQVVAPVPTGQ